MKSKIALVLTLAALLNPISVMALETSKGLESSSIACKEWAKGKILAAQVTAEKAAVSGEQKSETAVRAN